MLRSAWYACKMDICRCAAEYSLPTKAEVFLRGLVGNAGALKDDTNETNIPYFLFIY